MSMYQMQLIVEKNKTALDAAVKSGLKNLKSEGYNRERLDKIMQHERNYQEMHKKKYPRCDIPLGSKAMLMVCELLLPTCT